MPADNFLPLRVKQCPRLPGLPEHTTLPFVLDKPWKLTDPGAAVVLRRSGQGLELDLTAGSLPRFVELSSDGAEVI